MTDAAADTLNVPSRTASTVESGQRVNSRTQVYLYACLVIVAAIVIIPLLTTALGGFKTLGDLRSNAFGLPKTWMWSNYTDILTRRALLAADGQLAAHRGADCVPDLGLRRDGGVRVRPCEVLRLAGCCSTISCWA